MLESDEDDYDNLPMSKLVWGRSRLNSSSGITPSAEFSNFQECSSVKANVMTSKLKDSEYHYLMLDCDSPVQMLKSSTTGHSHLIFQTPLTHEEMIEVLSVLAKYGIIQTNYAKAAKVIGHSTLRAPGINKNRTKDNRGLNSDGEIETSDEYFKALEQYL